MLCSPLHTYPTERNKRPCTQLESQHAECCIADSLEVTKQIQQEAEGELRALPDLTVDSSSDEEQSDQRYLVDLCEEDTMLYPYPKYNDESDAEAHVRAFLTTRQVNHVSQRLSEANADKSKIVEFGLLLNGQSTNWYSQHEVDDRNS